METIQLLENAEVTGILTTHHRDKHTWLQTLALCETQGSFVDLRAVPPSPEKLARSPGSKYSKKQSLFLLARPTFIAYVLLVSRFDPCRAKRIKIRFGHLGSSLHVAGSKPGPGIRDAYSRDIAGELLKRAAPRCSLQRGPSLEQIEKLVHGLRLAKAQPTPNLEFFF